ADMPTARGLLSACAVDGKIYALGGATEDWGTFCYKYTEVYDPATDTWTHKSDMPTERFSLGTCVVNGKIYAIGGHLKNDACTANEIYDPITDTWITETPLQHKRLGHFLGFVEDKIYAIGGSFPNPAPTIIYKVEEYDIGINVPQPDFNGDGIVDMKDLLKLIQSWDQDNPTVDVAPLPYGDGIVDALDLEFLMSYWEQPFEDPSLIAHWALDETEGVIAYDSAGLNDAYLIGNPVWQPDTGMVGGALIFNGVNDYAFAPLDLSPADGPFSIFAWIKGGAPGQVIFSQSNSANWLGADSGFGCLITELIPPAVGRFRPQPLESYTVITDDQWHRVGFVWDGTNRTLYVDDILVAEDAQEELKDSSGVLNIGCGNNLTTETFWSGLIDDIRIYNRAVSP
ncbi:MAG: LamG-like jellyroll fold domain-containing protein, partial [Planctomycetota bacterium]